MLLSTHFIQNELLLRPQISKTLLKRINAVIYNGKWKLFPSLLNPSHQRFQTFRSFSVDLSLENAP